MYEGRKYDMPRWDEEKVSSEIGVVTSTGKAKESCIVREETHVCGVKEECEVKKKMRFC